MKETRIGLLGFGTVGAGVVDGLQRNVDLISGRLGVRPVIAGVGDLDIESDRGVEIDRGILTRDALSVVEDPDIRVIVELVGGTGVAREFMARALSLGKPVVTANKALLAEHGAELFRLARENSTDIYFGASVGGGIPIIRAVKDGLVANRINSICGILNGTCNYILTRMETEGLPFETVLADAQAKGYAEEDPALDIDGLDTAHKAVILASLAYGFDVSMEEISVEGIRDLSEIDIGYGLDLGYRIKLLAVIRRAGEKVEVRVLPAMVSVDHMLAAVKGVFNAVMVQGDLVGDSLYYGRGAGREPTASTVIADIADAIRDLEAGGERPVSSVIDTAGQVEMLERGEAEVRCYLRLSLLDNPGVLARITTVLGEHGVSIASVLQKEICVGEYVPVVIVTHLTKEKKLEAALDEINTMDVVGDKTVKFCIEE